MYTVSVAETPGEGLAETISAFGRSGISSPFTVSHAFYPHALLVASAAGLKQVPELDYAAAVLPCFETLAMPCRINAPLVVSYGMSPRASITASSIQDQVCLFSLQRDLPLLSGGLLEAQELSIPLPPRVNPEIFMAALGVVLLLGLPPTQLGNTPL